MELIEVYQAIMAVKEVVDIINENTDDTEVIPQEVIDVLQTFGDSEQGNNDVEALLSDIKTALVSEDDVSYMAYTAERLDIIDQRLNSEFIAVNDCLGLIATCFISFFAFKILTWLYNSISR